MNPATKAAIAVTIKPIGPDTTAKAAFNNLTTEITLPMTVINGPIAATIPPIITIIF